MGELVKLGLQLETLSPEIVDRVQKLSNQYRGVSSHDLEALALAEHKQVSLLTGDGKLRQVCLEEKINE